MDTYHARRLGAYLRQTRADRGLTIRQLAKRAGVDMATIVRIENGQVATPKPETLSGIAGALSLSAAELQARAASLPPFKPYLRARYGDLPTEAVDQIEASFDDIAATYGYDGDGPKPGQDEA